ncbi:MAG: type II toxin-antitoxin system HipA family toxin [Wenzhouxiangellaceae bacterium]
MSRARKRMQLSVVLNGRLVGTLERATNGAISFIYAREWLDDEKRAMPVSLSLPLREGRYTGAEVSSYFDNLLPDNDQIRRKVAERVGAAGTDAFNLLSGIGRDCVGALQFLPKEDEIIAPGPPRYTSLNHAEVAEIVRGLAMMPLGVQPDGEREFRLSIAGAQEKTALLWNGGWCLPKGATPTTHILKPQLGKLPNGLDMSRSVENEHFCLTLCRELGLDSAKSEIHDFEDVRVIAIERFDRIRTQDGRLLRLPQEDFCQALAIPSTQKYNRDGGPGVNESLSLLSGSDYAEEDRLAFLKAQMIFWLIAAIDGHAKNFSIFLTPGGRFRLTPIYDVMTAQSNYTEGNLRRNQLKLAMAIGTNRHYVIKEILPRHFLQSGQCAGVPADQIKVLLQEIEHSMPDAMERTVMAMPEDFPNVIAESVRKAVVDKSPVIRAFLS